MRAVTIAILFEAVEGQMLPATIPFKRAKLSKPNTSFFQALGRITQNAISEDKGKRLKSVQRFRNALQQAIDKLKTEILYHTGSSYRRSLSIAQLRW